ncbi:MAG TPA: serine/threonine-protein kinase, partial [Polyangiaceae bacterium]|nr:serine/threonine-protein kinase [Polyangiaceae bacterium]
MINAEEQVDRLVGATLAGNYAVVRIVGEGGMGRVYEARHTRIRTRRFAVKTLHGEYLRQPQALARFRREAEATASIDSPHVVDVYDVGRTPDGQPFIVSEYLKGNDLGDVLSDGQKLSLPRMVRIVRQICKGVAAAHDRGIVHRDLKPDNVFLVGDDATPLVKVVDFGISRVDTAETQLTRTGMIMGTPAYMAPEQARGAAVDARADIYSVGAILYRGLTGKDPFDRDDPAATLAAVLLEEPPPPRSIEPGIPEALELIIQRAMAKEPNARYHHIRDLDAALAPFDTMEDVTRGPRPRAGSRSSSAILGGAEREVRFARTLLTIFAVLGAVAALLALFLAADGIVTWIRGGQSAGTLTATESGVALLAVASAAITPAILVIRHLQRTVWTSTMRALELMR